MVSSTSGNIVQPIMDPLKVTQGVTAFHKGGVTPITKTHETDGLFYILKSYEATRTSTVIAKVIKFSWKIGTQKQCSTYRVL